MSAGAIRVLVTGFGAFPNAPDNPTARLAADLASLRSRLALRRIELRTLVLPVVFGPAPALDALVATFRPHALLHFGLAGRRRCLTVEMRAKNRAGILHPDAAGRPASALRIVPGTVGDRRVRLPVSRVVALLRAEGIACRPSADAGDYICNETLFRSLAGPTPIVGFIHVPHLRRRAARLTPQRLVRAAALAIGVAAATARRQERAMSSAARP